MGKDYYSILGLGASAPLEEIRKAYKKKALQFHPDKNDSPDAEEKFKELAEAYEVLSDCDKRRKYDQHQPGSNTRSPFAPTRDPFDLFKTFFNGRDPFADIFSSVFTAGELNRSSSTRLVAGHSQAKTTVEEQIGEGGTVHITKTIIGGDGSVRREMRFRTQSDSRVDSRSRSGEASQWIDRQVSAPNGYISTTSPITIKKVVIKTETVNNQPAKKPKEAETATATINIHPPVVKTARIKINVVRPAATENKENEIREHSVKDDKSNDKL